MTGENPTSPDAVIFRAAADVWDIFHGKEEPVSGFYIRIVWTTDTLRTVDGIYVRLIMTFVIDRQSQGWILRAFLWHLLLCRQSDFACYCPALSRRKR